METHLPTSKFFIQFTFLYKFSCTKNANVTF